MASKLLSNVAKSRVMNGIMPISSDSEHHGPSAVIGIFYFESTSFSCEIS